MKIQADEYEFETRWAEPYPLEVTYLGEEISYLFDELRNQVLELTERFPQLKCEVYQASGPRDKRILVRDEKLWLVQLSQLDRPTFTKDLEKHFRARAALRQIQDILTTLKGLFLLFRIWKIFNLYNQGTKKIDKQTILQCLRKPSDFEKAFDLRRSFKIRTFIQSCEIIKKLILFIHNLLQQECKKCTHEPKVKCHKRAKTILSALHSQLLDQSVV